MKLLLLFVVLAALIASAPAAAARIEVGAQIQHRHQIRFPPAGRAGDATSSHWIVRDRHGRVVGDMLLDCRWITSAARLCGGQVTMPLGTLALIGASTTRFIGQFAVVGGTGLYVGASGDLTFDAIGSTRYVLSITYR